MTCEVSSHGQDSPRAAAVTIEPAYGEPDEVRELFLEYAAMLGVDLCFQNFEDELKNLPGKYAAPMGRLYVARSGGASAGCVALRPHGDGACEMKRLYVRPKFRGLKIGASLVDRIIADARAIGYDRMILDTLSFLEDAIRLYRKNGFRDTEPYYDNPCPGVVYMTLDLRPPEAE